MDSTQLFQSNHDPSKKPDQRDRDFEVRRDLYRCESIESKAGLVIIVTAVLLFAASRFDFMQYFNRFPFFGNLYPEAIISLLTAGFLYGSFVWFYQRKIRASVIIGATKEGLFESLKKVGIAGDIDWYFVCPSFTCSRFEVKFAFMAKIKIKGKMI